MARRRKETGFDLLIEAFSKLPWKVCVVLAFIAGLAFHALSRLPQPAATGLPDMGSVVFASAAKFVGTVLQFLIPLALLIAALVSWLGERQRGRLLSEAKRRKSGQAALALNWKEFEALVAGYFESLGYAVRMTPDGADGGVDVVASKDGETYLVQCKQWRATQVGVSVVRELFGVMAAQGATGAFVVSAGPFTRPAQEFASGRNIALLNANDLIAKRSATRVSPPQNQPTVTTAPLPEPTCPSCSATMVKRVAKQGAYAGRAFWGCSEFPRCRGTVALTPKV